MLENSLRIKNIDIIRIDLSPNRYIKLIWRYSFGLLHKLIHWKTSYDFFRSKTHAILTTARMNKAIKQHGKTGTILINMSISHAPTLSSTPTILISDWSYDHYIQTFLKRTPDCSERTTIRRDIQAMSRAHLNILLFPISSRRLATKISDAKFIYISHVTNIHPEAPKPTGVNFDIFTSRNQPLDKISLVYVGRKKYLPGLATLKAIVDKIGTNIELLVDIIGINNEEQNIFEKNDTSVRFHGYLSKSNPLQRTLFYQVLDRADIMINLTPTWGPFSATLEAMYYYTAIISPPYDEFIEIFGEDAKFVDYFYNDDAGFICNQIKNLILNPHSLREKKISARIASENHSWEGFTDRLLDHVKRHSTQVR
jgi:glycosyltransferase involved in cell wall biosynthesis